MLGEDVWTMNQSTVHLGGEEDLLHPGWHWPGCSQQIQGGDSSQMWHWGFRFGILPPIWGSQLKGGIHRLAGVEWRCVLGMGP